MENDIIEKIHKIVEGAGIQSESEVSHLMSLFRKIIEHLPENERRKYFILRFFCDWTLHIKIERSIAGIEILNRLNEILVEVKDATDNNVIITKIFEAVSFGSLCNEMSNLLNHLGLPSNLTLERNQWRQFLGFLVEIILDCPLKFPDKKRGKVKEIYDKIVGNPLRNDMWVTELSIIKIDNQTLCRKIKGEKIPIGFPKIHLNILTSNTTRIIVPTLL